MEQIQDQVTKQALLQKSAAIAANFENKNLEIVIFGTVSAGKTSLINALLGEIVGEVAPTMGTTEFGTTHQIPIEGLDRTITITDSPGILEASTAGHSHQAIAEQLAIKADLLIFVVANDLRQSEFTALKTLVKLGKRSIVTFNKTDLFSDEEQGAIHGQLKKHVKGLIPSQDVVAISANPQQVTLPNGETFLPNPEINPLVKRISQILRVEGDDLLADNILLQSQQLGAEAQAIIERQRQRQAEQIIDRYQWIGAGVVAVTPLPVVDMLATAAVNTQMVIEIGKVYDCELNRDRGKELAVSLGKTLVSLGVVKGTIEILARALQTNFATYLAGRVVQGVSAAYLTRIAGQSFIAYFRQNQTWGDGGIAAVVKEQFSLSKKDKFIQGFMQDALSKVVEPLKQELGDDWEDHHPSTKDQW
ncbi:MAG: DUF697 domain-containing protein [Synechococcaceae cyanobacterium RL_1_2]|nr:DUF697 domain-containing protein [Synechococcaceae cyanobacterium RL_1_2]